MNVNEKALKSVQSLFNCWICKEDSEVSTIPVQLLDLYAGFVRKTVQ